LVSPTEYNGWPTSLGCSKFFGIEKRKFADLESHLSWGVIGSQFLFIYLFFFYYYYPWRRVKDKKKDESMRIGIFNNSFARTSIGQFAFQFGQLDLRETFS